MLCRPSSASHPIRVRELKPTVSGGMGDRQRSHPIRVRELKLNAQARKTNADAESHPIRVRVLKRVVLFVIVGVAMSPAERA